MPKKFDTPVVLGIDPGLTRCGIGVVRGPAVAPELIAYDCVRTAANLPLPQRLAELHRHIAAAIATYTPHVLAIEQVLFSVNVRTAMATGHAAGVVMLAAAQANIVVATYTPTEVKLSVTGSGRADKDAMMRLVAQQFKLATPPKPADAADALAIALTHLARARRDNLEHADLKQAIAHVERDAQRASHAGWENHPLVRAQTTTNELR
ncbi:MAG: crossover junction endodeoxyribonuclease RuvC [Nitriliruptoraceae bacterium]